jgi:hypothetical protein
MRPILAIIALLALVGTGGCAGEMEQPPDGSGSPSATETWTWPDITPLPDSTPWNSIPDGYTGAPFGCKQDSDCFGLYCCKTPWGVRLCAASCP